MNMNSFVVPHLFGFDQAFPVFDVLGLPLFAVTARANVTRPIVLKEKIGRNDLCPCGLGKKYKKCHGKGKSKELRPQEIWLMNLD